MGFKRPVNFQIVDVILENGIIAKGLCKSTDGSHLPLVIDFNSAKLRHRLKNGADSESIVKAIGIKASARRHVLIYDFTAGLGTEAFLLAHAGFRVIAFERDAIVFALLDDARKRYAELRDVRPVDLEFRLGDASKMDISERAYAVTMDPMFEDAALSGKSLPKKEMAWLRKMLQPSTEIEMIDLFRRAQKAADARVIVKRPNGAPDLISNDESGRRLAPVHRLDGKTARFDIYSCR